MLALCVPCGLELPVSDAVVGYTPRGISQDAKLIFTARSRY